jgi:hypothetical protein
MSARVGLNVCYPSLGCNVQGAGLAGDLRRVFGAARDILIPRKGKAVNEFKENSSAIPGNFPGDFPLGDPFPQEGTVPTASCRRLLLSYNPAYGSSAQLVFLLFSQLMRHKVTSVLAGMVKNNPTAFRLFRDLSADPAISAHLESAMADPTAVRLSSTGGSV